MKIVYTSRFKRDFKRAGKQNRDIEKLRTAINRIFSGDILDFSYSDHPLLSKWKGYRECHITPDWLLIYKRTSEELLLVRN